MDTTTLWRVETERPIMEEASEWLENEINVLEEEEESEDVVPLLVESRDTFGGD
jgi:hypothetical protein